MYLAIPDEEIIKRGKEVKVLNKKIIANFKKLPFWKRWMIGEDNIKLQVINNWREFGYWTTRRMRQKQSEDISQLRKNDYIYSSRNNF